VAGLTAINFYFRLYAGSVKGPQVVDFLGALIRHVRRPMLVVWDGLPAHRSRLVRDYVASLQGRIELAYLPPYAPELNPVEYIWAHWKQHELPNVCPKDYWQLSEAARRTLRRMRRRSRLITAFWKQSSLWPE
jgi:transposase